jgi:hypothetical protein
LTEKQISKIIDGLELLLDKNEQYLLAGRLIYRNKIRQENKTIKQLIDELNKLKG